MGFAAFLHYLCYQVLGKDGLRAQGTMAGAPACLPVHEGCGCVHTTHGWSPDPPSGANRKEWDVVKAILWSPCSRVLRLVL